jgi:hypothetical protein
MRVEGFDDLGGLLELARAHARDCENAYLGTGSSTHVEALRVLVALMSILKILTR